MDRAVGARAAEELVREANHRIANHLTLLTSMIQIQIDGLKTGPPTLPRDAAADHLRAAIARIVAIAGLHRRLTGSSDVFIDLGEFLSGTRADLLLSLGAGERLAIEETITPGCAATAEQASTLSLVMGEIVVNALKYAHPAGTPVLVRLFCAQTSDGFLIEIADDGVGLPEGFEEARHGGIGFKLMRSLVQKIGARLDYVSSPLGLSFRIAVPAAISY